MLDILGFFLMAAVLYRAVWAIVAHREAIIRRLEGMGDRAPLIISGFLLLILLAVGFAVFVDIGRTGAPAHAADSLPVEAEGPTTP